MLSEPYISLWASYPPAPYQGATGCERSAIGFPPPRFLHWNTPLIEKNGSPGRLGTPKTRPRGGLGGILGGPGSVLRASWGAIPKTTQKSLKINRPRWTLIDKNRYDTHVEGIPKRRHRQLGTCHRQYFEPFLLFSKKEDAIIRRPLLAGDHRRVRLISFRF